MADEMAPQLDPGCLPSAEGLRVRGHARVHAQVAQQPLVGDPQQEATVPRSGVGERTGVELDVTEGAGAAPLGRMALITAVFLGLATVGLAIGYALLGRPLGLSRRG
jgi:hypothetical protein